ncbi:MAG: phosphotransferase [Desulfobacterales bacterium]|nr:phosphotransferase [Desulfobacterales bacterium]
MKTKKDEMLKLSAISQIKDRFSNICRVHPTYSRNRKIIESLNIYSSKALIEECAEIENDIYSPFTVLIHGDFNTNNLVFNHKEQKINFIDLYRSKQGDYVQDASVFLISNYRLPIFKTKIRNRLNEIIEHFYKFYSSFARQNHDNTYELRMALALARSFYTSTRFELDDDFSKDMFLRAHFLMEKIASFKTDSLNNFKLPSDVLYY